MEIENSSVRELLGEARAIHLAMRHNQLTYKEAQIRVNPFLIRINSFIDHIAKKHKVKPRYIKFQDLGRNL